MSNTFTRFITLNSTLDLLSVIKCYLNLSQKYVIYDFELGKPVIVKKKFTTKAPSRELNYYFTRCKDFRSSLPKNDNQSLSFMESRWRRDILRRQENKTNPSRKK